VALIVPPPIVPLGDAAVLLTLGDAVDRTIARRVRAVAARIARKALSGVTDIVPAYATLAVYYDAGHTTYDTVAAAVRDAVQQVEGSAQAGSHAVHEAMRDAMDSASADSGGEGHEIVIPVHYDGPDLASVAEATGLSIAEVIRRHSDAVYYAYMLGFVPGFAYLGDLDPALVLPRRASPRQRVPVGSVAIAGAQSAIYPLATPGGWHLLGRTEMVIFDPTRAEPSLIRAGDTVRFESIGS